MPITPYNTPIKTEYKPLGLNQFAVPLSQMQQRYDLTQAAVEGFQADLKNLDYGTDKERADKLRADLAEYQTSLAENLMGTKNYREAALKLNKLKQNWAGNKEIQALEGNYNSWAKLDEEQRKRIDSGDMSREQYNQWKRGSINDYQTAGGASFKDGEYNKIGRQARLKNLDDDYSKEEREIANMSPPEKLEYFSRQVGGGYAQEWEIEGIKTAIEKKDYTKIKSETEKYMRNRPKYKAYFAENAQYDLEDLKGDKEQYNSVADQLVTGKIAEIEERESRIEAGLKSKNPTTRKETKEYFESDSYKDLMEEKQKLSGIKSSGNYEDPTVKNLYIQKHMDKRYDAGAIADVLDYKYVSTDRSYSNIPQHILNPAGGLGGPAGTEDITTNSLDDQAINYDGLLKSQVTAGREAYAVLGGAAGLMSMGGGAMRNLTTGSTIKFGRNLKFKNKKVTNENLGEVSNKVSRVYNALYTTRGNYENFKNTLKQTLGGSFDEKSAKQLFNDYNSNTSDLQTSMREGVTALNVANNKRNVAITQREAVDKQVKGTEDYKLTIDEIANAIGDTKVLNDSPLGGGIGGGTMWVASSYSDELLKKHGIPKRKEDGGEFYLTGNVVAQLNGFKNAKDALENNFNFTDLNKIGDLGNTFLNRSSWDGYTSTNQMIKTAKKSIIEKNNINTNMSIQATGSPLISQGIAETFSGGIGDVKYFDPVFSTWGTTPGFTDKGEIEPDTKLNFANVDATLAKNGNLTYMRVPYSWKTPEGDTKTGTLNLQFNKSTKAKATRFIQHGINQTMLRRDPAEKQSNDFFKEMKYDALVGDNIGNIWDNIQVVEGGQRLPLNIIDLGNGVEIHSFKQHFAGSNKPKVVAERINKATGKIEKTTYSDDVLDYKKWYAEDVNMPGR